MESYVDVFLAGLTGAVVLLMVLVIVLMVKISGMNKRYRKIIGNSQVEQVDDLLIDLQEGRMKLEGAVKEQADAIDGIRRVMKKMKAHVAVSRYNAFNKQGSDLSFSVAILDDEQDGVVLTGIHSREESYIYAKPVEKGGSNYALSPEEKEVIAQTAAAKR
ncbi:DUF4446 family protein [Gorillibacterium sp. sgz5001074]|uniref:DUF4446 family protein n=1 Tax=Gorillibacterium sp. sgz5001074 TaxID=3446695 RepID=UPI003F663453